MSALEKLKKLQTIQFRYREEFDVNQRLRAGFSAQQVKEGWIFNVRYECVKKICKRSKKGAKKTR